MSKFLTSDEEFFARRRAALDGRTSPSEKRSAPPPEQPPEPPRGSSPPPPPPDPPPNLPMIVPQRPGRWRFISWRNFFRLCAVGILLVIAAIIWLALTAPLSKSLEPPVPPSVTLLSVEGKPIARTGAIIAAPVDAAKLPAHVREAFLAIEDRRFYSHWGIDPRGIVRAMVHNISAGGVSEGGSTITQQLAKNAFLNADRTAGRKLREALIAFWLEGWLTKDQILSRYLSNVYFGDNVYGLRAAAMHYFSREPEKLSIAQAAMLAGLVKAPSRLAPSGNLAGARARQKLVVAAMVDADFLTAAEANDVKPASLNLDRIKQLPAGTYFADWVLPSARDREGGIDNEGEIQTTLEMSAQQAAERAVRGAGLKKTEVALIAMHTDGRVIAMVGGRDYAKSQFNRATAGNRQPGSTFKLFVYLAALRSGMRPTDMIDDSPLTIGNWSPQNSGGRYRGPISLETAFAVSSNVAAARLTNQVGPSAVIREARNLGISTPLPNEATIALGTPSVSLLELTAAYAAIASGEGPVRPHGMDMPDPGFLENLTGGPRSIDPRVLGDMRGLLSAVVARGTGRGAQLSVDVHGKTGTTQDNRDALFVGYAGDIVTGVWLGNDDNTPNPGLSGSGLPVRIWRDFMTRVVSGANVVVPDVEPAIDNAIDFGGNDGDPLFEADLGDGSTLSVDRNGDSVGLRIDGPDDESDPDDEPRPRQSPDRDGAILNLDLGRLINGDRARRDAGPGASPSPRPTRSQ